MRKLGILVLMAVMLVGLASAATFVNPSASQVLKGSERINVTTTQADNHNCTVTATSASSGDTLTLVVYNNTEAGEGLYANATYDTTADLDASDWSFTGTCYNSTGDAETITARTGITIDNTAPACTWSTPTTSKETYAPTQTWQVTATSANTCTLVFGANAAKTMTESSDVCTYTGDVKTLPEGLYKTVTATTSDGYNTTSCSLTYITIDEDATIRKVAMILAADDSGKQSPAAPVKDNTMLYVILLGGAAAYWYFNKK